MAFEVVASSYQQLDKQRSPLGWVVANGLMFGGIGVFSALVGILEMMNQRWIVAETLTLAFTVLIVLAVCAGYRTAFRSKANAVSALLLGPASGALVGVLMGAVVVITKSFNLKTVFIALKPSLFMMLSMKQGMWGGAASLVGLGAALGLLGAVLYLMPSILRRSLLVGLASAFTIGLFQELLQLMMQNGWALAVRKVLFTWDGPYRATSLGIVVLLSVVWFIWLSVRDRVHARFDALPERRQVLAHRVWIGLLMLALALFPLVAGNFIGQVLMMVGLFMLMGMGLNLEVGLAGLLDLGFVAFYAVGAYSIALLTAPHPEALSPAFAALLPELNFWAALPIAILLSTMVGVIFGIPVLKVRGDYLAVATLGLGEIVRVLVVSDMASPVLAGAQGVLHIPRPVLGGWELADPVDLFYLTLACTLVVAFIAHRLANSRLGRAWTAVRDDEDVAQALGINLVNVKLLAYGLGAAFAGTAGAIFAVMLGSIYPHSFQLIISINVLALIIVGGLGSLPGVAVGAAALIGLPELLREFGEYRFLFYGLVIVVMMRIKAEGLWPSAAKLRELELNRADAVRQAGEGS